MSNLSPAPGTPQTNTKAYLAGALSFVGTFLFALWASVKDRTDIDTMTATQWLIVLLGAAATALATGGFTYKIANKPT
jgi:nucleoside recognition membrane protein YjiH